VPQPQAGLHYPRSTGELRSWFGTDADCLDYLGWLRWPQGFVCPRCGHQPAAEGGTTHAAQEKGAPSEHGAPASGSAMESILTLG
jgi:hypothetical protein